MILFPAKHTHQSNARLRAASIGALLREARRAAHCTSGIAATEFALILPIMLLMFFGLVEGSDAMMANRRVTVAVNSLADLAAQAEELTQQDADFLFTGVTKMLEPTSGIDPDFKLVSVILENDEAVVHWSVDNSGTAPYAPGAPYSGIDDVTLLDSGASLIVVELNYPHQTSLVNRVFDTPIVFHRLAKRWPRTVSRVQLCDNDGNNCTS